MIERSFHTWAKAIGLAPHAQKAKDLVQRLSTPRPPFAGLDLGRPQVMGVINVTPDSFSDGGNHFDSARAITDGLAM